MIDDAWSQKDMREITLKQRGIIGRQGPYNGRPGRCTPLSSLRNSYKVDRKQLVSAPPKNFNYRSETSAFTKELIGSRYSELSDLVENGERV